MKHIIREVPPEHADFSFYFDDDGLTSAGGDFNYNLFIIAQSRNSSEFNEKLYSEIQSQAENIIDGFQDIKDGYKQYYDNYKEVMNYNNIVYNSRKCHLLKEWAQYADIREPETIADFLTITTGAKWTTDSVSGYCQGDYVEMVYCLDCYKEGVKNYGEVWLGAAKEFYTIELDNNGEETDTCGGYIVADCQARQDKDYKKIVCEWAGIPEDETRLEMIDGQQRYTKYSYRIV